MKLWEEIVAAQARIQKAIRQTPVIYSETFSKETGKGVFLKLENLQKAGSFKIRGAFNKLSLLPPSSKEKGVVAASAGNHAQGVALASSLLGIRATIVMPEGASLAKQMATRSYGGDVILFGQNTDEALKHAEKLAEDGRSFVHPYDDREIIAGQGTIGLEILEEVPDVEAVIVPVGGGGLISGIAAIIKRRKPRTKIIGVQSAHVSSAFLSLKRGKRVEVRIKPTLADGIALRSLGEINFPIVQKYVDGILTVREEEIASAILMLMERKRVVAEGAGAVPLAALLSKKHQIATKKVVLVISGGNIDVNVLDRIIEKGLSETGRIVRFGVLVRDVPGPLAELSGLIAQNHANILHVIHERASRDIPIGLTKVIMVLETRGPDHVRKIRNVLKGTGYPLQMMS